MKNSPTLLKRLLVEIVAGLIVAIILWLVGKLLGVWEQDKRATLTIIVFVCYSCFTVWTLWVFFSKKVSTIDLNTRFYRYSWIVRKSHAILWFLITTILVAWSYWLGLALDNVVNGPPPPPVRTHKVFIEVNLDRNDAQVFVDGSFVGNAPDTFRIEEGAHELKLVYENAPLDIKLRYVDSIFVSKDRSIHIASHQFMQIK
jgi:hypothetical protein